MEYKVVVYELCPDAAGQEPVEREVYRQLVEDLSIPAVAELVNNGRRRTRARVEKTGKGEAS